MFRKIREFFEPPRFEDSETIRISGHIFLLSKIALGLFPIMLILFPLLSRTVSVSLVVLACFIPVPIVIMWLAKRGYVRQAGTIFTVFLWVLVNYTVIDTGGVRAVGFGGNLVVLVAAAMLVNIQAVFVLGLVTSLLGLLFAYLQTEGYFPPLAERVSAYTAWVTHSVFLVLIGGLLYIAIDSIQRAFNRTINAEGELRAAYDTTLEGWAKALELKDKETEGHSRRVTDMAKELAIKLGVSENNLIHIYYGALLHDIGKMGIPDEILHKPGELTKEERKIIESHPVIAYDLLRDIKFLNKALEIPYLHHEKWDGEGYPNGVKGEAIPLSARIFAVIDVWDALNSDRPYRKAWPKNKVIQYMHQQSGKHFDPYVLDVFLKEMVGDYPKFSEPPNPART